ncbi:MAG: GlxA family transcriptional regulator [Gammaproteobacteria bacterium]|nr:GlxA family transcriptional regulator [Gammaproteobacteria bacterium]
MTADSKEFYPTRFGFLLLSNFTLISMASAVEPLRMANRICQRQHFSWKTISETGEPVVASDGLSVNVDYGMEDAQAKDALDVVIVCGGARVEEHTTEAALKFLKSLNTSGIGLGSTCTGSVVLAEAGVLDGYRCSVHWENLASLTDRFRDVQVTRSVYTIDRDRYTCSGGTAPVDMMLYFIGKQLGPDVAAGVAEQFIYERIRRSSDEQRIPLKHVFGNQSEKLIVAVDLMEANIREPIVQSELASYVGVSKRQLQRLFQRYLDSTPSRYYLRIRLSRARELLQQTSMSLVEIASLTGFVSSSHFSKSYKDFYGQAPSHERRRRGAADGQN